MKTIVFVDNDLKILDNCKRMLQSYEDKLNLRYFQYPELALKILDEQEVSVLVSELDMPVMSGEELFDMYAMLSPDTILIAMSSGQDIAGTLKYINETGIFKLMVKPFLLVEDIAKPVVQAVDYYNLCKREKERQLDMQKEIELLDQKQVLLVQELKEKQENYAVIFETIHAIIKSNLAACQDNLSQKDRQKLLVIFDDVCMAFVKCYIFESGNYLFWENYLRNLFHQPTEKKEFHVQNKVKEELIAKLRSEIVFSIYVIGYLTATILKHYRAMAVIEQEEDFYVVKYFCDFKKPEYETDPVYLEQNLYIQELLHDMAYRILSVMSFKTVKGIPGNPFTAKIYFARGKISKERRSEEIL